MCMGRFSPNSQEMCLKDKRQMDVRGLRNNEKEYTNLQEAFIIRVGLVMFHANEKDEKRNHKCSPSQRKPRGKER